jgi:hypothetical protein
LEESVLRSSKKTDKYIVAGATYKNTTHLKKESNMNLGELMYLESKTTMKDALYTSLIASDSILKPKIQLPQISNTFKIGEITKNL